MGQLVFVRHGQASFMSADYDRLSELGRDQARQLGRAWVRQGRRFDRVYTGPAKRHVGTADEVAGALRDAGLPWPDPVVIPELDEHDAFGMLQHVLGQLADDPEITTLQTAAAEASGAAERGRRFQRLYEAVMARWLRGEVDPGQAETWSAFASRVDAGLERIRTEAPDGADVAVFSSVGPAAVVLRRALGTADLSAFNTAWRLRNTGIIRLVFNRDRLTLDAFNLLSHLPDPADWTFR